MEYLLCRRGRKDETLLGIYSHMIDYPLYLPNYHGHRSDFRSVNRFAARISPRWTGCTPGPDHSSTVDEECGWLRHLHRAASEVDKEGVDSFKEITFRV